MTPKVEVLTAGCGQNRLCSVNVYNILQSSLGVLARNRNWLHIKTIKHWARVQSWGWELLKWLIELSSFACLYQISNHCK